MNKMKNCFLFIFIALPYFASSQVKEQRRLKLIDIDTVTMLPGYYLLTFNDSAKAFKVLSDADSRTKEGCWRKLKIGVVYSVHLFSNGTYDAVASNGVRYNVVIANGLTVGDKTIVDPGEHLYTSIDLNGLFILTGADSPEDILEK